MKALPLMLLCLSAHSASYYVSTNGNDTGTDGSISQPFATFSKGVSVLNAGDTLYIRGGSYSQTLSCSRSGSSGSPITISGYPSETAVVEGSFSLSDLVTVSGSYVVVQNLTAQQSTGTGFYLVGPYGQLLNVLSQSNKYAGVYVSAGGEHCVVSNCNVFYNSMRNFQFTNTAWSTGLSAANGGRYALLIGNRVWNNWGEGLSTFGTSNTLMVGNTVWDNKTDIYVSDCKYCLVSNNLVYASVNNVFSNSVNQFGIGIDDETSTPPSSDNVFVNNLVYGCYNSFACWSGRLVNCTIAFNTFAEANNNGAAANIMLGSTLSVSNSVFENNLILQSNVGQSSMAYAGGSLSGLTFSHNLWSTIPTAAFQGTGDVDADPLLAKSGSTAAGELSAAWFALGVGSPAIAAGLTLASVTTDYLGRTRPQSPSIGALEGAPNNAIAGTLHIGTLRTR